jgi:two-component system phosphate regulon sensor histidine kinase PhoR
VESPKEVTVLGDGRALDQVLLNLLDNAIKYTPEGGQIVIRSMRQNDKVFIEVEDNGPGIKSQHRERLFERFYRVDSGRSKEMGGTGLGLAIVKHLAGAMGGEAGMRPARPQGSVFWISLKEVS